MTRLGDIVEKLRSKNAGPFWLTIDIFCGSAAAFATVSQGVRTEAVAQAFGVEPGVLRRFDMAGLNVIKFSLPRPAIQGTPADRDMHGASFAQILEDMRF